MRSSYTRFNIQVRNNYCNKQLKQESLNNEREQFLDNILIQNKKLTKIYNQLEEKNIKVL